MDFDHLDQTSFTVRISLVNHRTNMLSCPKLKKRQAKNERKTSAENNVSRGVVISALNPKNLISRLPVVTVPVVRTKNRKLREKENDRFMG